MSKTETHCLNSGYQKVGKTLKPFTVMPLYMWTVVGNEVQGFRQAEQGYFQTLFASEFVLA